VEIIMEVHQKTKRAYLMTLPDHLKYIYLKKYKLTYKRDTCNSQAMESA
jgi:hypothetical protein